MPDPVPFRLTRRALRLLNFRRAAPPPAAPEPPRLSACPDRDAAASPSSAEIVRLEDRRLPGVFPWCPPMPPYVGAFILGAALATSTAAHVAADLSLLPGRMTVAALTPWSA